MKFVASQCRVSSSGRSDGCRSGPGRIWESPRGDVPRGLSRCMNDAGFGVRLPAEDQRPRIARRLTCCMRVGSMPLGMPMPFLVCNVRRRAFSFSSSALVRMKRSRRVDLRQESVLVVRRAVRLAADDVATQLLQRHLTLAVADHHTVHGDLRAGGDALDGLLLAVHRALDAIVIAFTEQVDAVVSGARAKWRPWCADPPTPAARGS